MKRNQVIIVGLIICVIIVLGYYLFTAFFEKQIIETRGYPSLEAIKNPFLAAERYLNATGNVAESSNGYENIIAQEQTGQVIVLNHSNMNLTRKSVDRMVEWMTNGGIIAVPAEKAWGDDSGKTGNPLLDRYGIGIETPCDCENEDDDKEKVKKDHLKAGKKKRDNDNRTIATCVTEDRRLAELSFYPHRSLTSTDKTIEHLAADDEAVYVLQKTIGRGKLIVFSDMMFLTNDLIGENDHAFYLSCLAWGRSKIWLVYGSRMPSLLSLIIKKAPFFCAGFTVLMLLCLLRLNYFTGPGIEARDESRRDITQFLSASAGYMWKVKKIDKMVKAFQKELLKKIYSKHPNLLNSSTEQVCAVIAEKMGIEKFEVYEALYKADLTEQNIVNKVKIQQRLLKYLTQNRMRKK